MKIPVRLKNRLDDFIKGMRAIYKEDLVSVIMYGSAASGELTERHSNVNMLVVLKDAGLGNIGRSYALINSTRFETLRPVFFSADYIRHSTDVFPLEFLDMKENHAVLYGEDVLKDLEIDMKNLRFQCEQELKSKIIGIKRAYMKSASARELKDLLFKSFTSSLHILRNLIRLKGKTPAYTKEDVIEEVSREFLIDAGLFRKILKAKKDNAAIGHKDLDAFILALADELEKVSNTVDRL